MPYPSISFRTELDPVVRKELDALSVQHEEYLSKEHKPDGTHGDLTADSAVIAGDLTVGGSVGFEDLSGNVITATTINCDILNVGTTSNILGNEIVTGTLQSPTNVSIPRWALSSAGGAGAAGSLVLYADQLGKNAFRASEAGVTIGDSAFGVPLNCKGDVILDAVQLTIDTNKFTVDGATGNTAIANGAAYYWATRAVLTSPADGVIQGTTNSAAAGARLNFTNNNQIVFQNLAGTDRADIFAKAAGFSSVVNLKAYTVATLPAGTRGDIAYVTDALAPAFLTVVAGGGAVVAPVFYDGTNWVGF